MSGGKRGPQDTTTTCGFHWTYTYVFLMGEFFLPEFSALRSSATSGSVTRDFKS